MTVLQAITRLFLPKQFICMYCYKVIEGSPVWGYYYFTYCCERHMHLDEAKYETR